MNAAQRTTLALSAILLLAGAVFAHTTRGFRAITSDGVRRIDLANSPGSLPNVMMIDSNRRRWRLSDLGASGKVTLVALIYTHCVAICRVSAGGQNYLQTEIRSRGLGNQVQLLTISFDPVRDTPDALAAYAYRQRADPDLWTVATVARRSDLSAMLAAFGVVVLPDEWGGYSHNAALFFVNERGRLAYAYDVDGPGDALADLLAQRRAQDEFPSH